MWRPGILRRRQHLALVEVIETAARTCDYRSPWHKTATVWDHFSNEGDILSALQQEWRTALAGAVYVAIDSGEGDLQADVMKAFSKMVQRHGSLRRILEANAEHPAIAAAMRKERALLSPFAGLLEAAAVAA